MNTESVYPIKSMNDFLVKESSLLNWLSKLSLLHIQNAFYNIIPFKKYYEYSNNAFRMDLIYLIKSF